MCARRQNSRFKANRRGGALVEFAFCAPILILMVLATIEACTMTFLQQSLEITAYEGARTAILPSSDLNNVLGVCQQILDDRGIQGATITVTPSSFESTTEGTYIKVEVSAPCGPNSVASNWYFGSRTLVGEVEMMRELDPPGT